jgi:hypothetical protein
MDQRDAHLDALWALLPRANRDEFQRRVLASPDNHQYITNNANGPLRLWHIGTADLSAPIASTPLTVIIDGIDLTPANRTALRDLLIRILRTYLTELGVAGIPAEPGAAINEDPIPVPVGAGTAAVTAANTDPTPVNTDPTPVNKDPPTKNGGRRNRRGSSRRTRRSHRRNRRTRKN